MECGRGGRGVCGNNWKKLVKTGFTMSISGSLTIKEVGSCMTERCSKITSLHRNMHGFSTE